LGYGLHPGADERDKLAAEEELKVAVAQGAQGCGPFRQARRFPSRFFSRVGIWRRSHASRTFSHLSDDGNRQDSLEH
jgi:hypothetical protein